MDEIIKERMLRRLKESADDQWGAAWVTGIRY